MPQATCPSCRTEQTLPRGATGYRCGSCGQAWSFSVCTNCDGRFHARPGVGAWTCPRCGVRNVGAGRTPASSPEPRQAPRSRKGLTWPSFMRGGSATFAAGGAPPWAPVAIGASAAIVVFLLLRVFVFDNGTEQAQPPSSDTAMARMCLHLNEFQVQRVGALRRGANLLVEDAVALRAAGDEPTAKKVDRLIVAARGFANALDTTESGDDAASLNKMLNARSAMPC